MMQQSEQEQEASKTITLDSIPQDVALAIVEVVKGWVDDESNHFKEKEKAKKTRDSTLRAIALSCRKNFDSYFPALLENVTFYGTDLISIQNLFQRENNGRLVRSLHVKGLPAGVSQTTRSLLLDQIVASSILPPSVDNQIRFQQGLEMLSSNIFCSTPTIETLIIGSFVYIPGLFYKRHAFLTNSLKELFVICEPGNESNLSVRNGIWLLLFVPSLSTATLGMEYSIEDFNFLLEFGDTVEGLSQVSKLSLNVQFVWNDAKSKTWWGLQEESYRHSAQGNQKTFAVSQLLRCVNTNRLVSLEIIGNGQISREGDNTLVFTECLTVLHQSFNSLLHLRLFGLVVRKGHPNSTCFSNFKLMKMLTLDGFILHWLQVCDETMVIPSSLEVIWLPHYDDEKFEADDLLLQFIRSRGSSLPKLKEVIVPKVPVLPDGIPANIENWTRNRERLEKEEMFTSGRVILRKAEEGEMVGDASKPGEIFPSNLRWISS